MAREIIINGESLIRVEFGAALSQTFPLALAGITPSFPDTTIYDLGLALGGVKVIPKIVHQDIHVDDFGPEIPAEVLASLAEATIRMTLVHWDLRVFRVCMAESMGGLVVDNASIVDGTLAGCGIPLGGGQPVGELRNHYVRLNIMSEQLNLPWTFLAAYLTGNQSIPLGTKRTLLDLTWRAIPYVAPFPSVPLPYEYLKSRAAQVWVHTNLSA